MKRLENKDISLVHSMIPLVSNNRRHVSRTDFRPSCDLILNFGGSSSGLLHHEAEQLLGAHGESAAVPSAAETREIGQECPTNYSRGHIKHSGL